MRKILPILFFFLLPTVCFAQDDISKVLGEIGDFIRAIAIGAAVLMLVIAGFKWMTSAGDPSKISDAKDQIFAVILGLLIIALAEIIAALVGG
jgi:hypothetical protein